MNTWLLVMGASLSSMAAVEQASEERPPDPPAARAIRALRQPGNVSFYTDETAGIICAKIRDGRKLDDITSLRGRHELRRLYVDQATDESLERIGSLTQLDDVGVLGQRLSSAGVAFLKNLSDLRRLSLGAYHPARIEDTATIHLRPLTKLEGLTIRRFVPTFVFDKYLVELTALSELQLFFVSGALNRGMPLRGIASLPRLKELTLEDLVTSTSAFGDLVGADNLTSLRLTRTRIIQRAGRNSMTTRPVTDAELVVLKSLVELRKLELVGNDGMSGECLVAVSEMPHLERLTLFGSGVRDDGLRSLAGLASLRELDLRGTEITDAGLANVAQLPNLRSLYLDGGNFTDAGLGHIAKISTLESILFQGPSASDTGLKKLSLLRKLRFLHLGETSVSEEAMGRLQRRLPKLKIQFHSAGRLHTYSNTDPPSSKEPVPPDVKGAKDATSREREVSATRRYLPTPSRGYRSNGPVRRANGSANSDPVTPGMFW